MLTKATPLPRLIAVCSNTVQTLFTHCRSLVHNIAGNLVCKGAQLERSCCRCRVPGAKSVVLKVRDVQEPVRIGVLGMDGLDCLAVKVGRMRTAVYRKVTFTCCSLCYMQ